MKHVVDLFFVGLIFTGALVWLVRYFVLASKKKRGAICCGCSSQSCNTKVFKTSDSRRSSIKLHKI